ncbi:MAG: ferritin-like domain-containing protein [Planctomycetota bacterium]|nr:ferritin-like domain-containing protein [Planctomycetota bacterium]MDA1138860.1 ferritin-like domain-containing protein [Planctomycetota bacterium]
MEGQSHRQASSHLLDESSTSADWIDYMVWNSEHQNPVPWDSEYRITLEERKAISKSIAIFQLGESGEGRHFINQARKLSVNSADLEYAEAARLFIAEEQRHSWLLSRFMEKQEIPRLRSHWSDRFFRGLRKCLNLEVCIAVLITGEILARYYYAALRDATDSPVLRAICDQILQDEEKHIFFQGGTLGRIRRHRSPWSLAACDEFQRVLFAGALCVVWKDHARAYRKAGVGFRKYIAESWGYLEDAIQVIRASQSFASEQEGLRVTRVEAQGASC